MSNPLLFVYGTLMLRATSPMGRSQRARLAREAEWLGLATVQGRLYNLGRYPGLTIEPGAGSLVHGEIVRLLDPGRSLRWLDAYEGIVPGAHDENEYRRVEIDALSPAGRVMRAWTYVYAKSVAGADHLSDGSWLAAEP